MLEKTGWQRDGEAVDWARDASHDPAARGRAVLEADLTFERAVFRNPSLSIFRRNATTWEVLLMLASAPSADAGPGLYEIVEAVETRALGPSALLRFLRERREEGSVIFTRDRLKQSKWSLSLREDLRVALTELLEERCRR